MARRSRRRLAVGLVVALGLLAACSEETASTTSSTQPAPVTSSTSSTILSTTTTDVAPTTVTTAPTVTTAVETPGAPNDAVVIVPPGPGPHPAVVLVHGGGWIVGNPSTMVDLAESLSANGFLTVNTPYQLSIQTPGFPTAVDDVTCAVRYAAAHPESNGEVTVIGHSAGAHIAAISALSGDQYASDCPWDGSGLADSFVGLAGPYDVDRLGGILNAFFGSARAEAADVWEAGSPHLLVPANPDLRVLLLHGSIDQVVSVDFSENFFEVLEGRGIDTNLTVVEGSEHAGVRDPRIVTDLIVDWLG